MIGPIGDLDCHEYRCGRRLKGSILVLKRRDCKRLRDMSGTNLPSSIIIAFIAAEDDGSVLRDSDARRR